MKRICIATVLAFCTAIWAKAGINIAAGPAEHMRSDVEYLCDSLMGGRAMGSEGHFVTEQFLLGRFRKEHLKPVFEGSFTQSFPVEVERTDIRKAAHEGAGKADTVAGRNIIGMLEGRRSGVDGQYILVTAYYDNIGKFRDKFYPGADANASGIAMMLEVMRHLRTMRDIGRVFEGNILFVAFDSYQEGRAGSRAFWNALSRGALSDPLTGRKITPRSIATVISLEQIGSTLSPVNPDREDYIIILGEKSLPRGKTEILYFCNAEKGCRLDISHSYYGSKSFTDVFLRLGDRRPFVDNRIPTLLLTSGITDFNNSTSDTPQTLNYAVMERRCRLVKRFIENYFLF